MAETTMSSNGKRSIGEILDELAGEFPDITPSKIRYLESQGLVEPSRTDSGYRSFAKADVETLRWVLRQQRDHFLPLKVIKARLVSAGGVPDGDAESPAAPVAAAPTMQSVRPVETSMAMSLEELMSASGLSREDLAALEQYGLIEGVRVQRKAVYDGSALLIARLAKQFADFGVEARHLRMFKLAAERESGVLEQAMSTRKRHELDELVALGAQMRHTLLQQLLDDHSG